MVIPVFVIVILVVLFLIVVIVISTNIVQISAHISRTAREGEELKLFYDPFDECSRQKQLKWASVFKPNYLHTSKCVLCRLFKPPTPFTHNKYEN